MLELLGEQAEIETLVMGNISADLHLERFKQMIVDGNWKAINRFPVEKITLEDLERKRN